MITIEIDEHILEMPDDFKLVLVIVSNVFNIQLIKAPRSYELTVPDTPVNRKALKYLNNLRVKNRTTKFGAVARDNGSVIVRGSFVVSQYSKGFSGTLVEGQFLNGIEGKNLKDFNYAADVFIGATPQERANFGLHHHLDKHIGFPEVATEDIYNGTNPAFCGIVNVRNEGVGNANVMNQGATGEDNKYAMLPAFDLFWIMQSIGSELGYSFTGNFFNESRLDTLLVLGGKTLDSLPSNDFTCTGKTNEVVIFGLAETTTSPVILETLTGPDWETNFYEQTRFVVSKIGNHRMKINFKAVVPNYYPEPKMRVECISEQNGLLFAYTSSLTSGGDNTMSYSFSHFYTAPNDSLYWKIGFKPDESMIDFGAAGTYKDMVVEFDPIQFQELNIYKQTLNYAAHMPDYDASEFLTAVCNTFGVDVSFNEVAKEVVFDLKRDVILDPDFWDITDKIIPGEDGYFTNQQFKDAEGYSLQWDSKLNTEKQVVGNGSKDVKLKLSPLKIVDFNPNLFLNSAKALWMEELKPATDLTDNSGENSALRMAFHNAEFTPINLSLSNADETLYTDYIAPLYESLNNSLPVTATANFNRLDLERLKESKKLMIDHTLFLLGKATVPRGQDGPGFCKLELWKI